MINLGMNFYQIKLIVLKFRIPPDKGFEEYADAHFKCLFSKEYSDEFSIVAKSWSG